MADSGIGERVCGTTCTEENLTDQTRVHFQNFK